MSSLEGIHTNNSFLAPSPSVGKLQFAWDSTSLGALKKCPRYYYYTIVEGYQSAKTSVHLTFGILYHSALERYDHARAAGKSHDDAVIAAARYCLEATWDKTSGRPWNSEDPNKNRFTLVRTIVWYLEQYKDDALETLILANGKPAVELSFRFETKYIAPNGQPFLLCGHIDKLASLADKVFVIDHKTSKHQLDPRWFAGFTPFNQFTLYTLAAKVAFGTEAQGVICNGAQIAVGFSRFQRGPIERSDFQLQEWYRDLGFTLAQAQQYAAADYWPMNDTSCDKYGGCEFREVCSKRGPTSRQDWLNASFKRRTWDPLVTRGDV